MGDLNFDKENKQKKSWKGFYLALAVCIVAVGGVATAGFLSMLPSSDNLPDPSSAASPKTAAPTTPATQKEQPVAQNPTDIPDDRTTEPNEPATAETGAPPADLFVLPLSNEVLREFSGGQPVFMETMGDWRIHNGVDFKGEENQQVRALADGTVKSIEDDPIFGKGIVIDHGFEIISRYYGVAVSGITAGDVVKVGDVIGMLCDIPCELGDGPHLHLEIIVNGEFVNPVESIGLPVRPVD